MILDETVLAFIARLTAEEGLLYTFEHRTDGHTLLLIDRVGGLGTKGHKAGAAKGIKSNTVGGKCYPLEKSATVRAEGKQVVRHGDKFWMNGV